MRLRHGLYAIYQFVQVPILNRISLANLRLRRELLVQRIVLHRTILDRAVSHSTLKVHRVDFLIKVRTILTYQVHANADFALVRNIVHVHMTTLFKLLIRYVHLVYLVKELSLRLRQVNRILNRHRTILRHRYRHANDSVVNLKHRFNVGVQPIAHGRHGTEHGLAELLIVLGRQINMIKRNVSSTRLTVQLHHNHNSSLTRIFRRLDRLAKDNLQMNLGRLILSHDKLINVLAHNRHLREESPADDLTRQVVTRIVVTSTGQIDVQVRMRHYQRISTGVGCIPTNFHRLFADSRQDIVCKANKVIVIAYLPIGRATTMSIELLPAFVAKITINGRRSVLNHTEPYTSVTCLLGTLLPVYAALDNRPIGNIVRINLHERR